MDLTRRTALQQVMLAGAGLALVPDVGWPAAWQLDGGRVLVPFEDIPDNFATRRTGDFKLPGQDALGIDLRNVTAKTPVNDTFVVSHYNTPMLDAAQWRLSVEGNAGGPSPLTLHELERVGPVASLAENEDQLPGLARRNCQLHLERGAGIESSAGSPPEPVSQQRRGPAQCPIAPHEFRPVGRIRLRPFGRLPERDAVAEIGVVRIASEDRARRVIDVGDHETADARTRRTQAPLGVTEHAQASGCR